MAEDFKNEDGTPVVWRLARFSLHERDTVSFAGWHRGELWNGWACPYFTKEEALKIVDFINKDNGKDYPQATYDAEADSFNFPLDDGEEPEKYGPAEFEIKGVKYNLYGTKGWVWELTGTGGGSL